MRGKLATMMMLFIIIVLMVPLIGCSSKQNQATTTGSQVVTVQRGNLSVDITAAGNLALSTTQDLPFDLFYTEGTVSQVLVNVGDTVQKGEILASIDQTEWDDQLTALQDKVTAAQQSLLQAQNNLQTSQQTLQTDQQNEATYKLDILNAQINLDQAQGALDAGITAIDYQSLEAALNKAQAWYNYVTTEFQQAPASDINTLQLALNTAADQLAVAQANYDNALAGYDTQDTILKKRQVESAKMQVAQAQNQLNNLPSVIAAA
jgi:multidrug efflux pump subunit AcrA (membrane-fusion protein)